MGLQSYFRGCEFKWYVEVLYWDVQTSSEPWKMGFFVSAGLSEHPETEFEYWIRAVLFPRFHSLQLISKLCNISIHCLPCQLRISGQAAVFWSNTIVNHGRRIPWDAPAACHWLPPIFWNGEEDVLAKDWEKTEVLCKANRSHHTQRDYFSWVKVCGAPGICFVDKLQAEALSPISSCSGHPSEGKGNVFFICGCIQPRLPYQRNLNHSAALWPVSSTCKTH